MTLDYTTKQFHYDSTTASFSACQEDLVGGRDATVDEFDRDAQQVVNLPAHSPWTDAFGTREFYRISATVAKPIEQPYVVDGKQFTFKKPADELEESVAWLDNKPFVLGHPASKTVKSREQIHGVWRNAEYVEDADELRAQVYIPANDQQALDWVETYHDVSVGFYNQLEQATDDPDVDAYQTNIYYDHVAGVRRGRCSEEDGCGLEVDAADAVDASLSTLDAEDAQSQMTAGETVTQSDGAGDATSSTAEDNSPDAGDETASTLESDSTMTDSDSDATTDCGCDGTEDNDGVELDSLSLDDLAEQHEGVAEVVAERDELDAEIDSLTEDKTELQERVEALQEKLDEKQAALDEYKTEEKRELVDEILDHSSYWDEDDLIDKDMETLEENLEIVKDAAASDTTANPTTDSQETEQTGARRKLDLSGN